MASVKRQNEERFAEQRQVMVDHQLRTRGIADVKLLSVMRKVPRHRFVSPNLWKEAYADHPLPIGEGQTISQPYIVALMSQALCLSGEEKVLEIGTGSGYQTAILAELANTVITIERSANLSQTARERLVQLGYYNVRFVVGDGTLGLPTQEPFDRILATGSLPCTPPGFLDQLSNSGILVLPVGDKTLQRLTQIRKTGASHKKKDLGACRFVPLIGKEGWSS